MFKWFKTLRRIVKTYDSDRRDVVKLAAVTDQTKRRMSNLESYVTKRTTAHVDLDMQSESTVIVIGRYRNQDYVRVFNTSPGSFREVIERLQSEERYAGQGRLDAAPDVRAVIDRDWSL